MFKTIKNKRHIPLTINHSPFTHRGQVILEFTFCMIVILIMFYGVIKVFHWSGSDLVERQRAHTDALLEDVTPREQIDPYFYAPIKMNAIWDGR